MSGTAYSIFRDIAGRQENENAVIEDGRKVTFGELLKLVDMIAGTFPEDVRTVGIVMNHRAEMVASILAVLKTGARYVPAEPDFPAGRIRYMMDEARADFILTERDYADRFDGLSVRFIDCEICGRALSSAAKGTAADSAYLDAKKTTVAHALPDAKGTAAEPALPAAKKAAADPALPAYVLYTSGTTGRPKGVCVTQANICHYVRAFANEFHPGPGDVMLQYSVCSFDIFVEEVFASLLNGAAIAIPSAEDKESVERLMEFADRNHVTMISGFPYLLAELNHLKKIPDRVRLLISGGDVLRGAYVDHLLAQAEVYNTYGPSETTVCASYYRCNDGVVLEDGTYPVGKAVKGASIRLLDADGREVPDGETGEICICGDGVSFGYIGDHDEENKAFEVQPDGSVMYRSGDLGRMLPDGNIAFLHRKDDQIMIYGKRVEVAEVESRLYQCRGVDQALVRAFTDEAGLSYMIAYIVPADKGLKVSDVRKELAQNLPPFMIPEFMIRMAQIPLNANGKPDMESLPVVMKEGTV